MFLITLPNEEVAEKDPIPLLYFMYWLYKANKEFLCEQ
jgi:hypothetical protein